MAGLAALSIAGTPKAKAPKGKIEWSIVVVTSDSEQHTYVFVDSGSKVPVDLSEWRCSYDPVQSRVIAGVESELVGVECVAGKIAASTSVICGHRPVGRSDSGNLAISAGKKRNVIMVSCEPPPE